MLMPIRRALLVLLVAGACHPPSDTGDSATPGAFRRVGEEEAFTNALFEDGTATRSTWEATSGWTCPDGLPGRFEVIAPVAPAAAPPAVLVLHGGVFDAVVDGAHLAATDKLSRDWAACKLSDFLGQAAGGCEDEEENGGAVAAALARTGAVAVYPLGCWGDLWHGTGHLDPDDGFPRQGLAFARAALAWVESTRGTDPARRFAWGTSAGGHGMAELVVAEVPLGGMVVDSPADWLPGMLSGAADPEAAREAIRRIFEGDGSDAHVGAFSLAEAIPGGARPRLAYLYSCRDTAVPVEALEPAAEAIFQHYGPGEEAAVVRAWTTLDQGAADVASHVFSNGRIEVATALADWLLGGVTLPASDSTFRPCDAARGDTRSP